MSIEDTSSFNHGEADTRVFVHAGHPAEQCSQAIYIEASDTDVLVMAVFFISFTHVGTSQALD